MAQKPIAECTRTLVDLCQQEKEIIRDFQRKEEDIYGKKPSIPAVICSIISEYGELIKLKQA